MRVSNPPLCFSAHFRCFLHRWHPDSPSVFDPNSPPSLYKRFSQPARRFSPSVQLFETPNVCSARRFLLSFERLPSSTLDILHTSILPHAYTPPCLFLFLFFYIRRARTHFLSQCHEHTSLHVAKGGLFSWRYTHSSGEIGGFSHVHRASRWRLRIYQPGKMCM